MSTSLAPDSQEASKVDPFTQRMIDSTQEFYEMSISFEWNFTNWQRCRCRSLIYHWKVWLGSLSRTVL